MWAFDFNKNQGPGTATGKPQPSFGLQAPSQPPSAPPSWFNGSSVKHEGHQNSVGAPIFQSHNRGTDFPLINQVQDLKRTRSPPILSTYKDVLQNSTTAVASHSVSQTTKSPHIYQGNNPGQGFGSSSETRRPSVSPPRLSTRPNSQAGSQSNAWHRPSTDLFQSKAPATNPSDFPVPKRTRLPFTTSTDPGLRGNGSSVLDNTGSHFVAQRTKYPHVSQRNNPVGGSGPSRETRRPSVSYADLDEPEVPATNPIDFPVLKGTRLPFTTSTDSGLQGNDSSVLDDTERPSVSPPRLSTRPNSHTGPQSHVWRPPYSDLDRPKAPATNPSNFPVLKRSRLPFTTSPDPGMLGNDSSSVLGDTERYDAIGCRWQNRWARKMSSGKSVKTDSLWVWFRLG